MLIGNVFINFINSGWILFLKQVEPALYMPSSRPSSDFFIRFSLELNYFERRPAKTNYLIFNCTGNVRQTADLSPGDIGGGVMANKVWYRTKPKMVVYPMSDIDIA